MKKPSFTSTLLSLGIVTFACISCLSSLPVHAVVAGTFTLELENALTTTTDKISLCENGVFRKGWDGTVKGRFSEPGISIDSSISILYGSVTGTDCTTPANAWKKVKELSSLPRKYAQADDTIYMTLSGAANIISPQYISPIAGSPATSISPNNVTQISIVPAPAPQLQPVTNTVCVDGVLLASTPAQPAIFSTTPGVHIIKFAPKNPTSAPDICAQVPDSFGKSFTIVDGKNNIITSETLPDYAKTSVQDISASGWVKRTYNKSSPLLSKIDSERTGLFGLTINPDGNGTVYTSIGTPGSSAKGGFQDLHFRNNPNQSLIVIEYDPTTSLPDDEVKINNLGVSQLFGGADLASDGTLTSRDAQSGLSVGKMLSTPISISMGYIGHVTIVKSVTVDTVIPKWRPQGTHIATVKGFVSNSPFVPVPTSYTVNAQGDYVFSSNINGPVGQYILLDTFTDPVTGTKLLRTGGDNVQNQMQNVVLILAVTTLLSFAVLALRMKNTNKK
jgi:hypothetical protein